MRNNRPLLLSLISTKFDVPPWFAKFAPFCEVLSKDQLTAAEFAEIAPQVDILLGASNLKAGKEELDLYPNLRMVAVHGVGYDGYDIPEIARRGLYCSNTPDVLSEDVADFAIALMLGITRRIGEGEAFVRAGRWPNEPFPLGRRIAGKRVGIAGLGRIGRIVAQRCEAFRMEVGYTSRSPKDVPWQRFENEVELARWADVLIVVIPATPETFHLIDAKVLEALGPDGFLVNIARGALVDSQALIKALEEKRIAGAALDVFEHEPNVEPEFFPLKNVLLAPHQGSATVETRAIMEDLVVENVRRMLAGEKLATPIPGTEKA
ncbi:2-hydroxyacid dehydrogenase [Sutterella sp.]|uniref:2-hydroxyacid dehydrogenase n=1 Tax=Sutterella sp. TaxID=1981025 RepID=UPI0026E05687|nr:2-hydroxyacid dehydrogenase [Sutterella sp.]MDO5532337.1 2-hydroxyacid dehydrogenase [Sutterella sp.]